MEPQNDKFPITGTEGSAINIIVAAEWTANHRSRHKRGLVSHFFGEEIINQILQQPDCMGIRIYYANSKGLNGWQKVVTAISNFLIRVVGDCEGERHFIITGVSKTGQDQLPPPAAAGTDRSQVQAFMSYKTTVGGNTLAEQSIPCPGTPGCPTNALTGGGN